MLGLVLILPLLSFVISFLIPERYSWLVGPCASMLLLASAILSFLLFFSAEIVLLDAVWFKIGLREVHFSLGVDSTSRLMIMIVPVISFLIHLYSIGYMTGDSDIRRYFAMLGFFTFSMLGIVVAGDFIQLFVFWELVGFSSYVLIGHYVQKSSAAKAAKNAFLYNRIGDAAFLTGILIGMTVHPQHEPWVTASQLCIFGGIIAKSAQLPLSSWLSDAMEGPTPVSALLHAATMVVAGIFLLVKLSYELTETSLLVITITGSLTALYGAICALSQFDIKKILAYSTISQLGLMVTAIGMGVEGAAMLHLFTHAFFKAGLFLAAGSVIHAVRHQNINGVDPQDIRNLGGLRKKLPVTFLTFCITGASLAGIPFFSGFISKESILTQAMVGVHAFRWPVLIILLTVSFCTVLYVYRMIRFIFFGDPSTQNILESPWVMRIPMIILAVASCWFVVSLNPFTVGDWFRYSFIVHTSNEALIASVIILLVALPTAWFLYHKKKAPETIFFFQHGFLMDAFYKKTFGVFTLKLSTVTDTIDRKWIDGILHLTVYGQVVFAHGVAWFDRHIVDGIVNTGAWLVKRTGSVTRSFQGGRIQLYIFWAVTGLIIFLFFALI